jgi:hypothetical protein
MLTPGVLDPPPMAARSGGRSAAAVVARPERVRAGFGADRPGRHRELRKL